MDDVKDVVRAVLGDLFKKQKDSGFQKAADVWARIAGPKAARHTKIVYLTKDKIRINVDSSAWLYELNLKKERIQKEFRKSLNVQDVRLRLGSVKA